MMRGKTRIAFDRREGPLGIIDSMPLDDDNDEVDIDGADGNFDHNRGMEEEDEEMKNEDYHSIEESDASS